MPRDGAHPGPAVAGVSLLFPGADLLPEGSDDQLLFEASPAAMWVYDVETLRFLAVNKAATVAYGYSRDEFLSMTILEIRPPEDVPALLAALTSGFDFDEGTPPQDFGGDSPRPDFGGDSPRADFGGDTPRPDFSGDTPRPVATAAAGTPVWRHRRRDGSTFDVEVRGATVTFAGRRARLVLATDVSARLEIEEALSRLALHDSLTGLPNRSLFLDRLALGLRRLERKDTLLAVFFVDLDRFKMINDRLGHAAGDQVVVAVGSRLGDVLRPHDTIARLGGDEFAVLCEDLEDDKAAASVAQRILAALDEPIAIDGHEVPTSASIGISSTRRADVSPDALLRDADIAMYRAKETGRHRFEVFDNSARHRAQARLQIADELRLAIESDQLRVFFQPLMSLGQVTALGVEALVRWEHPTRGLLEPETFIRVAEETGLVVPLGAYVLRQACRQLIAFDATGAVLRSLSVNLSGRQLGRPELIDTVREVLDETGLDPGRLCFEITESVLLDGVEFATEALDELRSLGVSLAIDDFGTGYSSLGYLRRFPVDIVKLDRSFVAGLGSDSAADAIAAAVINLSHALGLRVVAEGVENLEQLTVLRALRCDSAQGYYWSRPLPAAGLAGWLRARPAGPISAEPVDLAALVAERALAVRGAAPNPVVVHVPAGLAPVFGDEGAVRSILDHLLSNAVKYSQAERPVLVSAASDRRWVRVSVADYGIGMSADEANRCFEPFWQADIPSQPELRGTGVGLYIVRSLVEEMGGHVAVTSARGAGSTFTFALPRSSKGAQRVRHGGPLPAGIGEDSSIREFMRQIGVPTRRGA